MKPRDIDMKISELVFKHKDASERKYVPFYSTSRNEVMKVVEEFAKRENYIDIHINPTDLMYEVYILKHEQIVGGAKSDYLSTAICEAVLDSLS